MHSESAISLIIGHKLTPAMREFFRHISWSFFGGITASAILLTVNILAGRWLGPEQFGKYNTVWALAQIITVFIIFGMDTSNMRAATENTDNNLKKKSISTTFYFILFSSCVFSAIYYLFITIFKSKIHIDISILYFSLLVGLVLSLRQLSDSFLRTLLRFKFQSFVKIIEALIVFATFLVFVKIFNTYDYSIYIISLAFGGLFAIIGYLFSVRKYFHKFDFNTLKQRFSYAKIMFAASVLGIIFGSLDKLVIAKYMNFHDLGVYSAYYTASFALAAQFMVFFDNVFFPTVAKYKSDMQTILKKIDRLCLILIVPVYLAMSSVIYLVMSLFGKDYNINLILILCFGFLAVLKMILSINSSLVAIYSNESLKKSIYFGNTINILFVVLFIIALPFITVSIQFMVLVLIAYHVLIILMLKYVCYSLNLYTPLK